MIFEFYIEKHKFILRTGLCIYMYLYLILNGQDPLYVKMCLGGNFRSLNNELLQTKEVQYSRGSAASGSEVPFCLPPTSSYWQLKLANKCVDFLIRPKRFSIHMVALLVGVKSRSVSPYELILATQIGK